MSEELSCDIDDIVDVELNVCDTQPSCLGGGNNEFIFSGRLDNLASSYCALRALIDSTKSSDDLSSEHAIRMVALFDNEEVTTPFNFSNHEVFFSLMGNLDVYVHFSFITSVSKLLPHISKITFCTSRELVSISLSSFSMSSKFL